jgi:transcriptional regulator with XRE-family HTH domain
MMLKVKARRVERNLTLEELSSLTDLTVRIIRQVESGLLNPPPLVRIRLAKALDADRNDLFTDIDKGHDYLMNKLAGT